MAGWGGRGRRQRVRNAASEAASFGQRALVGFVIVACALIGLATWYFKLQVIDHDDYARRSEANRIKPRPVVPGRGLIYDRKGRLLADNIPAFRLDVTPEDAGDIAALVEALGEVVSLTPQEIARFERERKATRSFRAVTLKQRLDEEEVARLSIDRWRFPGVEVVPYLTRSYPYGELFAHVIGYVGRTDESDVARYGQAHLLYPQTGRTGLERYHDAELRGRIGYEQVETNVEGRALRRIGMLPAKAGSDLQLSLDMDLQRAMVLAFDGLHGSAVAVEPATGQVLGMVSLPSFDANLFVNGIGHEDYRRLMDDPARPLFNRNVLGGGPPGSTIKPFVALAGLDSGLRTPEDKVFSTGEFFIPGQARGYRDAAGPGGWVDLRDSISRSINFYYYKLAYEMGIQRLAQYMDKYGFGKPTGIDLVGETAGIVPSPAYKASRSRDGWYPGETVIAGIGQGYWIATSLQLARATAALANGGNLRPLKLVAGTRDSFDQPWRATPSATPERITDNPAHLKAVLEGMENTIHGRGTATAMARGAPYRMAGKTGTAQRISRRGSANFDPRKLPYHLRHQALFVGFAPVEDPQIAIAVVVEHGGYGGTTAAPIARKIFDAWLLGKMPGSEDEAATATPPADARPAAAGAGTTPTAVPAPAPATTVPAGDGAAATPPAAPERTGP